MKKAFCLVAGLVCMAGCTSINNENGSEFLVQLKSEPTSNCEFLYKITTDASVYSQEDAVRMMENKIIEQENPGNAYLIVSNQTKQNDWVMFGPEYKYILVAKVFDCKNF
ncbi:MAG: hypothetical protein ACLRFI_02430 [Alphaproteobacteria bacterium]